MNINLDELLSQYVLNIDETTRSQIGIFCEWLFFNAPTGRGGYFPYKPYLVLSILKRVKNFNETIDLDEICKDYFDYVGSDPETQNSSTKILKD